MSNYENPNAAATDNTTGEMDICLRTECPVDAEMIRCVIQPWLLSAGLVYRFGASEPLIAKY